MEPTTEQLREFMIKNYGPEWADNLNLAKMLWKKKQGQKVVRPAAVNQNYVEVKKFSDIDKIGKYSMECILFEISMNNYMGCPKCKRKSCSHGLQPVEYTIINMMLLDKAGDVKEASYLITADELTDEYEAGDLVKVEFFFKNDRIYMNNIEVKKVEDNTQNNSQVEKEVKKSEVVNNQNVQVEQNDEVSDDKLKEFLKLLDNLGRLNKLAFERMAKDWNLSLGILSKYITLNNGYYELNESGEQFINR